MTLIATYEEHGRFVLIGDLLLTSDQPVEGAWAELPFVKDLAAAKSLDPEVNIAWLGRKIHQVGGHFAIAWTGFQNVAAALARLLDREFLGGVAGEATLRKVLAAFSKLVPSPYRELTILGCCVSPEGRFRFAWDLASGDFEILTGFLALGSGASTADKTWQEQRERSALPEVTAAAVTGGLLQRERRSQESLKQGFGGGYEIVVEENGSLQAVDSITYVPLRCVEEKGQLMISLGNTMMKYGHINGVPYLSRSTTTDPRSTYFPYPLCPLTSFEFDESDITLKSAYYCFLTETVVGGQRLDAVLAIKSFPADGIEVRREEGGEHFVPAQDTLLRISKEAYLRAKSTFEALAKQDAKIAP